ncbi:MAG: hypothetical protein ACRDD9_23525 [Shewanella sp.]
MASYLRLVLELLRWPQHAQLYTFLLLRGFLLSDFDGEQKAAK